MLERKNAITMKNAPMTLLGNELKIGERIPNCEVTDKDLKLVPLSSFFGKILVIASVPSLDTDVCSREGKRFNDEVAKFGNHVTTLFVSMDLPFAQKRWCGSEGVHNLFTLSDYQKRDFGQKFGVLIKEISLLARCVFVVDASGTLRYIDLVKEVTTEPNYQEALKAVQGLLSGVR